MNRSLLMSVVVAAGFCVAAVAAPPGQEALKQVVADYFAQRPTSALQPGLTAAEALDFQKQFVKALMPRLGQPVGYKVGLVTKEAQQRVGIDAPLRGTLLAKMILPPNSSVSAAFGPRPLCEADLIVVVKDEGINRAKTPLEALEHLSEIVAFIELPDQFIAQDVKPDGHMIAALNVGARLGVTGDRIPVTPSAKLVDALAKVQVIMTDQTGADLGKGSGAAIMGNPLNAVLWLAQDLARTGETLKAGDLISLGTMMAAIVPKPGQEITVRYEGLPSGPLKASVRFNNQP